MSLATALAANAHTLDVTLFIEGVPIVFGTRAGLVHPMTDLDGNTLTNVGALTSVVGLKPDGISVGHSKLNWETLIMEPASWAFDVIGSLTWDRYFTRRVAGAFIGELTYDGTAITVDDGVIPTPADYNGRVIYCERESMLVTSTAASTLNVTRAYCDLPGTRAQHRTGNTFSFSPPYWVGRRCEIRTWLGGQTLRVVYGVIQASPLYDKGAPCWKLQIKDTMSMLDRKIAVGFTGGPATGEYSATAVSGQPGITVTPSEEWADEASDTAADNGYLFIQDAYGDSSVTKIASISVGGVFTIYATAVDDGATLDPVIQDAASRFRPSAPPAIDLLKFARRCYVFKGSPMVAALNVMLSRTGNSFQTATVTGAEPIGDRLYGRAHDSATSTNRPAQWGEEKRFGAGFHKLFLDVHSAYSTSDIAESAKEQVPGWFYLLGVTGEESLLEFLTDVALAHGGFWFLNYKGQISFRRFRADIPGFSPGGMQSFTVTDDHISRDGTDFISVDDESEINPTQTIECNWDPMEKRYMATFNLLDMRTSEMYREKANNSKLSRKGFYVTVPGQPTPSVLGMDTNAINIENLRTQMERVSTQRNMGLRKYTLRLPFTFAKAQPGDRFTLTSKHLIDFAGASVSALNCMALQVRADPRTASVDVELVEKDTAKILGITLEVLSYDAGTKVITLVTGAGLEWDESDNTRPTDFLPGTGPVASAEGILYILDKSAAIPYGVKEELTVTSFTATTITLSVAPTVTPAVGDLLVFYSPNASDSSLITGGNNAYGQVASDFAHVQEYDTGSTGLNPVESAAYPGGFNIAGIIYPSHRWG